MGGGCAQCNITKLHDPADFRCVPANVRLWRLEICVLCPQDVDYDVAAGMGCFHAPDSCRSRQPLPCLGLLQRAQKFAVHCKNTASE